MTISTKLIQFMVAKEDGDQAYYEKTEEHWDWPGGASGPTAGCGYDCGYVTPAELRTDWTGIVDDETIKQMLRGQGIVGTRAHMFVIGNRTDITITWAQAMAEVTQREVPKWEMRTRMALPNFDLLSPDCQGALVSLSYNRGTAGYASPLPRFKEMVAIRQLMVAGRWPMIPPQIASMIRLWPNEKGLRDRRVQEAQLFAEGLGECQALQSTGSTSALAQSSSSPPASATVPSNSTT